MTEVRPAIWDDFDAYFAAMGGPFAFTLPPAGDKREQFRQRVRSYARFERNHIAEDAGQIVGTLGVFDLDLTVPGGSMTCAGTTGVAVSATHRRRGVLRALMTAHLEEAIDHGDPIAALWASESSIYDRFGFGVGSRELRLTVDRDHAGFRSDAPTPEPTRFIDLEEAAQLLPPVYERIRRDLPGSYGRSDAWWTNRRLRDDPDEREGMSDLRTLVSLGPGGEVTGYAQIRIEPRWGESHADHKVRVIELFGTTPESWAGIWSAAIGHDLAGTVEASHRALDDTLLCMLAAPRRTTQALSDNLWIRILDVEAALTGRSYSGSGSLTFGVSDRIGLTEGTWHLETDGGATTCSTTDDEPLISFDIEVLGAAMLGRPRFFELMRVGRVDGDPDVAIAADRIFRHHRAPVCPEVF